MTSILEKTAASPNSAAMFLPSLLTAWMFRALSIRGLMIAGLLCLLPIAVMLAALLRHRQPY